MYFGVCLWNDWSGHPVRMDKVVLGFNVLLAGTDDPVEVESGIPAEV